MRVQAFTWLNDKGEEEQRISYRLLLDRTRALARVLVQDLNLKRGDRVVLCYPPGVEFFIAFWACLGTGVVAVPICPPDPSHPKVSISPLSRVCHLR